MIRRLALALLLLAACKSGPSNVVDLTIVVDGAVPAATMAKVRTLTIAVTGVHKKTTPYPLPSGLPKQETVQLLPTVTSGVLDVTVTATDQNGVPLAMGEKSVTLTGKEVPLTVTLSMAAPPMVTVTPATATVTQGKTTALSANLPVDWTVMGGAANGTVDANGLYTAPMTPGTYTVVAADKIYSAATATATIVVVGYDLEIVAGQLGGFGELDGVGGAARLTSPAALASDGNGTLYVGERFYSCVLHKIDLATQQVTMIGGKAFLCQDVDGKLGSTALFSSTWSLAYDGGNKVLYVGGYNRIRKINLTTGDVTTLSDAGGQAILFGGRLAGMAYDGAKYLYAANDQAHIINRIDVSVSPPVVTTFAGIANTPGSGNTNSGPATLATFNGPSGLALDGTNLYVADNKSSTIRKIVIASGITTTLSGNPGMTGETNGPATSATFKGPFGLALSPTGTLLFVSEDGGQSVRGVAVGDGSTTTIAGMPSTAPASGMPATPFLPSDGPGAQARFGNLAGIAVDGSVNQVFVGDFRLGTVRAINAFGNYATTTLAGTPFAYGSSDGPGSAARFWSMGSLTGDGSVVYLADNGNATIRKYDVAANSVTTIAGKAGFYGGDDGDALTQATFERPEGMFLDGNVLYISDGSGSTIRALDLTTKQVTTVAGKHLATGTTDGIGAAARLGYPIYITGDHNGHLYVSDSIPAVRQLTLATGELKTVAGGPNNYGYKDDVGSAAQFSSLYGLAIENNALYLCDGQAGVFIGLRKMTLDTFSVSTVAGGAVAGTMDGMPGQFLTVGAATGDGKGHIYVGDAGLLRRFDVASGMLSTVAGKPFVITDQPGPLANALVGSINGVSVLSGGDLMIDDALQDVLILLRIPPP